MLGTVFPLTVISKCRKWHVRGTYLEIFRGEHAPGLPSRITPSALVVAPKTSLYLVDRIGISGEVYSQSKFT